VTRRTKLWRSPEVIISMKHGRILGRFTV